MTVIRFESYSRLGNVPKTTTDVLDPDVRAVRARRQRRRRLGAVKMRKALHALERQSWNVPNYLRWLKETIADDPDPRAVVALMYDWDDELLGDLAPLFEWLAHFAEELARRRARRHKPKLVE